VIDLKKKQHIKTVWARATTTLNYRASSRWRWGILHSNPPTPDLKCATQLTRTSLAQATTKTNRM